ncbi:MAG: YncE family protein [Parcubacteria group bacterium]
MKKYWLVFGFLLAVGIVIFAFARPTSVEITAYPSDSVIKFGDQSSTDGKLTADFKTGAYDLEISRQGFKTHSEKIELKRAKIFEKEFALEPLKHQFSLETQPEEAQYRLTLFDASLREGKSLFEGELPAGSLKIKLTADGYQDLERVIFLDQDTDLTLWLDQPDQLLHNLGVFYSGPAPKGVALTSNNKEAWVTRLVTSPAVGIYDPFTGNLLDEIDLGGDGGVEVVFNADSTKAYASQMQTAKVYEIDTATRQVERIFDTESAWSKVIELSPDGRTMFVANWSGDDVAEFDLESGQLRRRLSTVDTPRGLYVTPDSQQLYVAGFGAGELERIDLADGSRHLIHTSDGAMRHFAADEDKGVLYISDMAEDVIWLMDLATEEVSQFVDTESNPNTIDLSPDKKVLYVSNRGVNDPESYYNAGPEWGSILAYDTETGKILDAIVGGNQCTGLDVSDDGRYLIFTDFLDNRARFYEIPDYETLAGGNGGRAGSYSQDLQK